MTTILPILLTLLVPAGAERMPFSMDFKPISLNQRLGAGVHQDNPVTKHQVQVHSVDLHSAKSSLVEGSDPVEKLPSANSACVHGVLELPKGHFRYESPDALRGCERVVAHGTTLELFASLDFQTERLEFEGDLTLQAKVPCITCLKASGTLVVAGNLSIRECQCAQVNVEWMNNQLSKQLDSMKHLFPDDLVNNEVDDDEWEDSLMQTSENRKRAGGGLHAREKVIHSSGNLKIINCSAELGGAIRTNNFTQLGGHVMIANCSAISGGGIWSTEVSRLAGTMDINNCRADGHLRTTYSDSDADHFRGMGGGIFAHSFEQSGGVLAIQSCRAVGGQLHFHLSESGFDLVNDSVGGGLRAITFELSGGTVKIQHCASMRGAALSSTVMLNHSSQSSHVTQSGGNFTVENCSTKYGGAIEAEEFKQLGGELLVQKCVGETGAAIKTEALYQSAGSLTVRHCNASKRGGAIDARAYLTQSGGHLDVQNCMAGERGGAIVAKKMLLDNGDLRIRRCTAQSGGGGAIATLNFNQQSGYVNVEDCVAGVGGAIDASDAVLVAGGVLEIRRCVAKANHPHLESLGGAINAESFRHVGGNVAIQNCVALAADATASGGGIYTKSDFHQLGGDLSVTNCHAESALRKSLGGCISSEISFKQSSGHMLFRRCSAGTSGGAVYSLEGNQADGAMAVFEDCQAGEHGGSMYLEHNLTLLGSNNFVNSAASGTGGGLYVGGSLNASSLSFHRCTSKVKGAALHSGKTASLLNVSLDNCVCAQSGTVLTTNGDLNALHVDIHGGNNSLGQITMSAGQARLKQLRCYDKFACEVVSQNKGSWIPSLFCSPGAGREDWNHSDVGGKQRLGCHNYNCSDSNMVTMGCYPCPDFKTKLVDAANGRCQRCPREAEVCLPTKLKMPSGMTIDPNNIAVGMFCPNPTSCPGGTMKAPYSVDEFTEAVHGAMCQEGYVGDECCRCGALYGMADDNPMRCTKCPASSAIMRHIVFYVAKDSFLFFSAAFSALTATGSQKNSAVFLNQLMAFATVSNIVMTAVTQSKLFKELRSETQRTLESLGIMINIAQAQGDSGSSMECLLRHFKIEFEMPQTLVATHLASAAVPITLVATMACVKGSGLSLVLGANVFLSGFTAAFGKYLVAFRSKPEDQGGILQMPFLPGFGADLFTISAAILLCFAGAIIGWLFATIPVKNMLAPVPAYTMYLTGSYKPNCRSWEIEGLVRKMLLSLATSALPVSYSPALQMECVSLVLIASLSLHIGFMPYKEKQWNFAEIGLLLAALVMTGLTTTIIANDLHFARSRTTADVLTVLVIGLASTICGTMLALVFRNIYLELQAQDQASGNQAADQDEFGRLNL